VTRKRSRRIFQAGSSAIICKGIVLGVNAISIPLAVRYLGAEQFGIWVTISTTLALLIVLDLGIASAMTNLLSEAYALNDKELAGRYATTGLVVMVVIALCLGIAGAALWPFVPWAALFRLSGEANERMISHAVAAAYSVFLVGLPAGLAAKFLGGYQEIKTANIFAAVGAAANLLAVVLITQLHGSIVVLVAGTAGATVGTNLACLMWLWFWHKPWLLPTLGRWNVSYVRPLMQSGSEFFILQLAGLIVFNSDNFVIAHYLGPQMVTPYSVTWRLVGYTAALQIVITPALWPAYSEAWVRRDIRWIRKTLKLVMLITMSAAFLGTATLVLWGRTLIRLWAGPAAVPSQTLLVLMCVWILIGTFMANTSTVLLATNTTTLQAWLSVLAAIVNLSATIWMVQRIGSIGVILGTIGSYALVLVVPQTWQLVRLLRTPHGLPPVAVGKTPPVGELSA
jgi:O-antigen/teichoic acid export membrane protein